MQCCSSVFLSLISMTYFVVHSSFSSLFSLLHTNLSSCLILHVTYLTSDIFFDNLTSSCFIFWGAFILIFFLSIYPSIPRSFIFFSQPSLLLFLFALFLFIPVNLFSCLLFLTPVMPPPRFGHNTSFCCIFYYAAALPR